MLRLILSNLVLAYVAFLLGYCWPKEIPEWRVLRFPPPTCGQEIERLTAENTRLTNEVFKLRFELASKEDIPLIVRETFRQLFERLIQP